MNFVIKSSICVLAICSLAGCTSSAYSKPMGEGRYHINSWGAVASDPNENFTREANRICPKGYKILERNQDPFNKEVNGSVECNN